jgi:ribonuclease P/MRP protein subunit POP1
MTAKSEKPKAKKGWVDLPEFCDASASVSASIFAARRLPEIKSLWQHSFRNKELAIDPVQSLASGGRKTSSRHLRRRVSSNASRKRHRYPTGRDEATPEQTQEHANGQPCRWKRRKPALLQSSHETWRHPSTTDEQMGANDTTKWMTTHIWHAKRFRMQTLWGWQVPIMHTNRGAGAALRLLKENKTLIQDVTWCMQPICLPIPCISVRAWSTSLQRILPDFDANKIDTVRESVLHDVDQFPSNAIAPLRYCCTHQQLLFATTPGLMDSTTYFYFWTHPSIQNKLFEMITDLAKDHAGGDQSVPRRYYPGGLSCIRLRGFSVAECLQATMKSFPEKRASETTGNVPLDKSVTRALYGELSKVELPTMDDSIGVSTHVYLLPSSLILDVSNVSSSFDSIDILCDPARTKQLFLDFVIHGGACPIGVVEEAHVLMEGSPPYPVFPRDYPDTVEGDSYWKGLSDDWGYMRKHWEGGAGRIRESGGTLLSAVTWTDIVETDDQRIVAMRGTFGKVLSDLLQSASNPASSSTTLPRVKKRRRAQAPWKPIHVPPLSMEGTAKLEQHCHALSESLTLPAVILCHLTVHGKGTLAPGTKVLTMCSESKEILGIVTSCSFSPSRGAFHGLAVCGWRHLLLLKRMNLSL